jgi:hypothetical protein
VRPLCGGGGSTLQRRERCHKVPSLIRLGFYDGCVHQRRRRDEMSGQHGRGVQEGSMTRHPNTQSGQFVLIVLVEIVGASECFREDSIRSDEQKGILWSGGACLGRGGGVTSKLQRGQTGLED